MFLDCGCVGIGPQLIALGDKIVVCRGAEAAFALRGADDGHYRLLGNSYLGFKDIMSGVRMRRHIENKTWDVQFCIR